MIISIDSKFKTNKENIEHRLQHYGLRKIQSSLYVGDLDKNERKELIININNIIKDTGNVLAIPLCKNCYSKKESCGRKIKFKNELYKVF